jgi:hypothetical protein
VGQPVEKPDIAIEADEFADRRGAPRRSTLLEATVADLDGFAVFDCTIRNVSDTGALLVFPSTAQVPDVFFLTSVLHRGVLCTVAWRTERQIGVQFDHLPIRPICG